MTHLATTPNVLHVGLECNYLFNGVYLNKFSDSNSDWYRIKTIGGIADPDVRDIREDYPGRDGQIAFESFYGGRTITLSGEMRAGNLNYLRYMENNLRTALNGLDELPLYFNFHNTNDDFSTSTTADYYGFTTSSISGSAITAPTTGTSSEIITPIKQKQFENLSCSLKFNSASIAKIGTGFVFKSSSLQSPITTGGLNGGIRVKYYGTTNSIKIENHSSGSVIYTYALTNTLYDSTNYWMVVSIVDNVINFAIWTSAPTDFGTPLEGGSYTLTGSDASNFGDGIYGYPGVIINRITSGTYAFTIDDLNIYGINPADVYINCKKSAPFDMTEEQNTNLRFLRPFMITLRASNPIFQAIKALESTITPTMTTTLGRSYNKTYDFSYNTISTSTDQITISNYGNYNSKPYIRIYGPCTNPIIKNQTTGKIIILASTILSGDYYDIDIENNTVTTSSGFSKISDLSVNSDEFYLAPGSNVITLGVATYSSGAKMKILYRSAWI